MKLLRPAVTAAFALGCVCLLSGCPDEGDHELVVQTKDGPVALRYTDLEVGKGKEIKKGDTVMVLLVGKLESGRVFANQQERSRPIPLPLIEGKIFVPGLLEGVPGMKVGGKRVLYIPAALGYGAKGANNGQIPPNANLVYEVEVVRFAAPGEEMAHPELEGVDE
jgi:FKBP-type peptidyl-prolyl cis-trans isomerase